jgi:hypothetical protein
MTTQNAEDLAAVIDGAAIIELLFDQVILLFYQPQQQEHFSALVLSSSVLPLGTKLKIVSGIAAQKKHTLSNDSIHRVLELRNAFAHHSTGANVEIQMPSIDSEVSIIFDENLRPTSDSPLKYFLHVVDGKGRVKKTARDEALSQFQKHQPLARKELERLVQAINPSAVTGLAKVSLRLPGK